MEEKRHDVVSWNLSALLIQEIAGLLSKASTSYIAGKNEASFETLKAVKMRCIQSLNKDERAELKKIEETFSKESIKLIGLQAFDPNTSKTKSQVNYYLRNTLNEYNEVLMDMLHKYGYLIEAKKDATKMKF